jgi:ATP-dependent DNA ligase
VRSAAELSAQVGYNRPPIASLEPLVSNPRDSCFGSSLKLSRVHWVRPEVVAEVTYLTWTEDNPLRAVSGRAQRELHSARMRSDAMSYITISKPLSVDHLHRLKRCWQRGWRLNMR